MALKKDRKQIYKGATIMNVKKTEVVEENSEYLVNLSFESKSIKSRYIFPFNENFSRKNNYKLKDIANILDAEKEDNKLIF